MLHGDSGGTQTRDTQNRNLVLYSTELRSRELKTCAKIIIILGNTKTMKKKNRGYVAGSKILQ